MPEEVNITDDLIKLTALKRIEALEKRQKTLVGLEIYDAGQTKELEKKQEAYIKAWDTRTKVQQDMEEKIEELEGWTENFTEDMAIKLRELEKKQSLTKTIVIKHGNYIDTHTEEIADLREDFNKLKQLIPMEWQQKENTKQLNELKESLRGTRINLHNRIQRYEEGLRELKKGIIDGLTDKKAHGGLRLHEIVFLNKLEKLDSQAIIKPSILKNIKRSESDSEKSIDGKTEKKEIIVPQSLIDEAITELKEEVKILGDVEEGQWGEMFTLKEVLRELKNIIIDLTWNLNFDNSYNMKEIRERLEKLDSGGEKTVRMEKDGNQSMLGKPPNITDSKPPEPKSYIENYRRYKERIFGKKEPRDDEPREDEERNWDDDWKEDMRERIKKIFPNEDLVKREDLIEDKCPECGYKIQYRFKKGSELISDFVKDDIDPFLELYKIAPESEEYQYWKDKKQKWENKT